MASKKTSKKQKDDSALSNKSQTTKEPIDSITSPVKIDAQLPGQEAVGLTTTERIDTLPLPTYIGQQTNTPGKTQEPRNTVKAFAVLMEKSLRKHDATKGNTGWDSSHVTKLIKAAQDQTSRAEEALIEQLDLDAVQEAAIDLGNYAMMIWDRVRILKEKKGK